ncbi:MAG: phage minor capsid protein [Bacilli bacterium]
MLSEETLEKLSERLVDRIESLNQYFIKKLGKQINMIGQVTPSQLKELLQSIKYGNDIDEIMNEIAKVTNKNVEDIYEIFEEVAKKNQLYAKQFYDYKKVKYIPFEENDALQRQVSIIAKATATEYINMSKTMAYVTINNNGVREFNSLSDTYQRVTDEAILSIQQGRESFDTAVKRTMKQLTSNGLRTVDYDTGYSRRLDSSVRMSVMDGIRRLNRELQEQFGNEFGADGVEVSHHKNAAPDHIDTVDGQQFSKDEYKKINDSLERHVGELNCYHFVYPIVLGVSEPMYSKEELEADKKANKDGFEFEGTQYTNYEGTQLQRQLETKIRQYKDRQIGAKAINDKDEVYRCQEKITQLTQKYNDLSKVSGLPTKIERLRVEGYRKVSGDTRKYYESQLIGTRINDISINGISNHLLDRKTSRNIKVEDVKEAFTTPLKIDKIKIDEQGRKSIKYIGEKATVSINPDTGTIITVWKTSSNRVKKLKGDK